MYIYMCIYVYIYMYMYVYICIFSDTNTHGRPQACSTAISRAKAWPRYFLTGD